MGTIIKAVAVAKTDVKKGILALTCRAARRCLKNADISIEDVGILINSGVYTENHLKEPAFAALLQNSLQKRTCVQRFLKKEQKNMFSFDLQSGGGGVLNAIQVINGFIQTGEIENGLVVAGDTKPISAPADNYKYTTAAGAIVLAKEIGNNGFVQFKSDTYADFIDQLKSSTNWDTGDFRLITNIKNGYLKNCVACAIKSIKLFLNEEHLSWSQIDLIIPSLSPEGFGKELQRKLELTDKISQLNGNSEIFSAGVIFSLDKVFQTKRFQQAKNILFVTAGAGISISLSLYKNK